MVPSSGLPDLGGLSSNIISDFGPILSLFGEQVAKQFMSQSMGWLDHIIFAMAPLGIITAVVGAIRVGGSGWLRATIGRARENYATAEVELMSSTSHEVCEMWNGQNIVRIMGSPEVREVIYKKGEILEEQNTTKEQGCGLHSLEEDLPDFLAQIRGKSAQKPHAAIEKCQIESPNDEESGQISQTGTPTKTEIAGKIRPRSAPNISLNIHSYVPKWELYLVALIGILLQTSTLVYAYHCTYNSALKLKLGVSLPAIWAWYFTFIGTLSLITGILGCCYIIEKSTTENTYQVQKDKGEMHILWLQKGETVNDQVFNSHVISTKNSRSDITTSRRNDKITNPNLTGTHVFEYTTAAAAIFSLVGFIIQFMGLRGMHWSVSVAQVLATMIMTILRMIVRRGLSECPHCHELPSKHEMDWLATRFGDNEDQLSFWKGPERMPKTSAQSIWSRAFRLKPDGGQDKVPEEFWGQGCWHWRIITGAENPGYEPLKPTDSNNRAQKVVEARKRLGYLTQWPGAYSDKATSIAAAIEHVMNVPKLFASNKEFLWSMNVDLEEVQNTLEVTPPKTSIEFKVEKDSSGKWKADLAGIEAVLSLWMFSVSEKEKNNSRPDKKDRKDEFLRSGKASRQQGIRLLGPSTPSSRRDMKWWIGSGLSRVLEVDFSKPAKAKSLRSVIDDTTNLVNIKPGNHRLVGFAGGKIDSGTYKTLPLSEVPIGSALDEQENPVPKASSGPRLCLAAVSDASLDLLFAQEMFSAFMWAFAKSPYTQQIKGQTKLQPQSEQSSRNHDWQTFALQNTTLSSLARKIESTGLGNLDEIYMSILPSLIAHCRLPDADALVDSIHQKTEELQLSGNWEKATEMYLWVFQACSHQTSDSNSTTTLPVHESDPAASTDEGESTRSRALIKAAATLTQFLQALSTETEIYKIRRAPRPKEGIFDPIEKFRDELARLVKKPGDMEIFVRLAWLYKRQCRDVDWGSLLNAYDKPNSDFDITDIKNSEALGLTTTHRTFLSSWEPSFKWEGIVIDNVHEADVLGWTPLHYAASIADNTLIQQLLKAGADWRLKDLGGWTPLHYAAASKKAGLEIQWEYLKERIDLDSQGRDGFSPLHCSAISGNIHMARILVESGASPQTRDNSQKTPLHWAAYHGFTEILSLILEYGASPSARDESGKTPLHLAAIKGSSNATAVLAKVMGGMIDIKERDGWTAMQIAAFYGHSKVIEILLDSRADVNMQGGEYGNALQAAARSGHFEALKVLLDHVHAQEGNHGNTLQAAAADGHVELIKALLNHGVDVNAQGGVYGKALQAAARSGHFEALKVLLDHVHSQGDDHGNTLQAAAADGDVELIEALLNHGVDFNAQGGKYENALHAAIRGGHVEAVKALLNRGAGVNENARQATIKDGHVETAKDLLNYEAEINSKTTQYRTTLQAAIRNGHVEAVKLVLDHLYAQDSEYGNALQAIAADGHVEIVKALLDSGADVNGQGGKYGNALQAAAWKGNVEVMKMLLDRGADVNAQGGRYWSALQAAARGGHLEVLEGGPFEAVKMLLDSGADVNAQGGEYGNALQAAAWRGDIEVVEMLLDHGADANAQGGRDENPLQAAAWSGIAGVVKVLLDRGADANVQGGRYGNPLQAAAWIGNVEVVEVFLNYGVDVNMQGGEYGSALQAAACMKKVNVVKVLLEHGAGVNAQGGRHGNALQAAAWMGNVEVVELLLGHGVDVNIQGGEYGNALQAAAYMGKADVVKVLFDRGANVNMQGGRYGNALQAAVKSCNIEIVKLMLDRGAEVNAQGGILGSAIKAATLAKHDVIRELLLDHGAEQ